MNQGGNIPEATPSHARFSPKRAAIALCVAGHLIAAAVWLWLMPGGFPWSHPRTWTNRIIPAAALVVLVAAIWLAMRRRPTLLLAALVGLASWWTSLAATWYVVFPQSHRRACLVAGAMATLCWVAVLVQRRQSASRLLNLALAACAVAAAVFFTRAQRAPEYPVQTHRRAQLAVFAGGQRVPVLGTQPGLTDLPDVPATATTEPNRPSHLLSPSVNVLPEMAEVAIGDGELRIDVRPLLIFESRSPDGCWTILAPRRLRVGRPLRLERLALLPDELWATYAGDESAVLRVIAPGLNRGTTIEAATAFPRTVYSHLNTFCQVEVHGHRNLSLVFGPCHETPVEVLSAGYPIGKPARLAYLDDVNRFRVVEARSGEKGPFRELTSGWLTRSEPLVITFIADGRPAFRATFHDWSAQADTSLSPTAGWGLPANSIEFQEVEGGDVSGYAALWFTLAGTSVGRGWDSVAHAPGVYRNRVTVERL